MKNNLWFFLKAVLKKINFLLTARIKLEIDYEKPLEQIIAERQFDSVFDNSFLELETQLTPKTGKREAFIKIFKMKDYYNYEKAVKRIKRGGYEPATLYELLAFDQRMPDFQRKNPVAAFGHVLRHDSGNGLRLIPCLWGGSSFRRLIVRESNPCLLWGNGIYCLGVKK